MSITSVIRYVQALDSTATDGSGKTGLAFGDVTAKYLVQGGVLTALTTETITTLGTYQAPTDATHIRIKELAGSDPSKGIYEVHFHDTQVVSTPEKLWLFLSATGARFQPLELDLATMVSTNDKASTLLTNVAAIPTAAQNAAGLLDLADGIETGITPRQAQRLILAAAAGKLSGAATTTIIIRNVGDTKARITATVDSSGNRTAIITDGT